MPVATFVLLLASLPQLLLASTLRFAPNERLAAAKGATFFVAGRTEAESIARELLQLQQDGYLKQTANGSITFVLPDSNSDSHPGSAQHLVLCEPTSIADAKQLAATAGKFRSIFTIACGAVRPRHTFSLRNHLLSAYASQPPVLKRRRRATDNYPTDSSPLQRLTSFANRMQHDRRHITFVNYTALPQSRFVHHHYENLVAYMRKVHSRCPNITRLYSIGKSVLGRELLVLEISDNAGVHEPGEPEFKYVGNMHGNEVVSREVLLYLADFLCTNYGRTQFVTDLVDSTRVHLLPTMNPDGYENAQVGSANNGVGRLNAKNIDLNRNFPDQYRGMKSVIQPETAAAMRWIQSLPFVLSANLHGGSVVANYPFDGTSDGSTSYSRAPDDAVFRQLALAYAASHPRMKTHYACSDYITEKFDHGITNGAHWYPLYGGMQDYNYLHSNCFELTIEVSCHKYPQPQELPRYWHENMYPLLSFMAEVHRGIRGFVTDVWGHTLAGVEVDVEGIAHAVKSATKGDYWRLLVPGRHTVRFRKSGYTSAVRHVTVTRGPATVANVTLLPGWWQHWSEKSDYSIEENLIDEYLSTSLLQSEMAKLANSYPQLASLETLGNSRSGQPISALVLGSKASHIVPTALLIGTVSANERAAGELLVRTARYLLAASNRSLASHSPLHNARLIVTPILDASTFTTLVSENCSAIGNASAPIAALDAAMLRWRPQLLLALRTGARYAHLPAIGSAVPAHQQLADSLAADYVKHWPVNDRQCPLTVPGGVARSNELDAGDSTLLELAGRHSAAGLEVYTECCALPRPSRLPHVYKDNKDSLLRVLDSFRGQMICGQVVDNASDAPIATAAVYKGLQANNASALRLQSGAFCEPVNRTSVSVLMACASGYICTTLPATSGQFLTFRLSPMRPALGPSLSNFSDLMLQLSHLRDNCSSSLLIQETPLEATLSLGAGRQFCGPSATLAVDAADSGAAHFILNLAAYACSPEGGRDYRVGRLLGNVSLKIKLHRSSTSGPLDCGAAKLSQRSPPPAVDLLLRISSLSAPLHPDPLSAQYALSVHQRLLASCPIGSSAQPHCRLAPPGPRLLLLAASESQAELSLLYRLPCCSDAGLSAAWSANLDPVLRLLSEALLVGINGRVVSDSGQPLANVSVTLSGVPYSRSTDADGRFYALLRPGAYTLRLSRPGFATHSQRLRVFAAAFGVARLEKFKMAASARKWILPAILLSVILATAVALVLVAIRCSVKEKKTDDPHSAVKYSKVAGNETEAGALSEASPAIL